MLALLLLSLFVGIRSQTDVAIQALGAAGNSAAGFGGAGVGANVAAQGELAATDSLAASAVQVIATGPVTPRNPTSRPTPRPTPRPTLRPTPRPTPRPMPSTVRPKSYAKTHPVPAPTKKAMPYYPKPKCEDIKDDKCYKIHDYKYCGFCVEYYYPIKGYACKYGYEYVMKKTGSKKEYTYDKVLTPKCDCKGEFIIKGDDCPDCDDLLHKLFKCAGVKDTYQEVEIPEKCLKETRITVKVLVKCGYVEEEKDDKKIVIAKKDKQVERKPMVLKIYKEEHKPAMKPHKPINTESSAQASATAIATGGSATVATSAVATTGRKF